MFVSDLRKEFFELLKHQRVLVLVNLDVDAICAVKILSSLFHSEQILYTLVPLRGRTDLIRAFNDHTLTDDGSLK